MSRPARGRRFAAMGLAAGLVVLAMAVPFHLMTFERHDYTRRLEPYTGDHVSLEAKLRRRVTALAAGIGPRNRHRYPDALAAAESYLVGELESLGLKPALQHVPDDEERPGRPAHNLVIDFPGASPGTPVTVIGAHYDTFGDSPGADDNASGVAALLALAESLAAVRGLSTPVSLVFFVNEELPYFQTGRMGSHVYARSLAENGGKVRMMLSLDAIAYFVDGRGTQIYAQPFGMFYDDAGDFLAVIGNLRARSQVKGILEGLRRLTALPLGGLALPSMWEGAGESDHWSFWQFGYKANMITDTALYRNPYYHRGGDMPETLDFRRYTLGVSALIRLVMDGVGLGAGQG